MLTARKNIYFERIFGFYNSNLLRRYFNSLKICGLENVASMSPRNPIILYANHSSWWDGLIAFEVSRILRLDSFFLMEEKHLRKLFLFRRLGAFSVVRDNPRSAVESLRYAVKILTSFSNRSLWIFPQGEIVHNDTRPIFFYNGISRLVNKIPGSRVVPVAFRYEFLGNYKPDIFIKIGTPAGCDNVTNFNLKDNTKYLARIMEENLDDLKNCVMTSNFADFAKLI